MGTTDTTGSQRSGNANAVNSADATVPECSVYSEFTQEGSLATGDATAPPSFSTTFDFGKAVATHRTASDEVTG